MIFVPKRMSEKGFLLYKNDIYDCSNRRNRIQKLAVGGQSQRIVGKQKNTRFYSENISKLNSKQSLQPAPEDPNKYLKNLMENI